LGAEKHAAVVFGKLVIEVEIVNVGDVVGIGTARFLEVVSGKY
jgi:hypothetical protein